MKTYLAPRMEVERFQNWIETGTIDLSDEETPPLGGDFSPFDNWG